MNPAPKTYQLKTAPASALGAKARTVIFHQAVNAARRARPGLNTYALTAKILGRFQSFTKLPEPEFWKLVNAFKEIAANGHCSVTAAPQTSPSATPVPDAALEIKAPALPAVSPPATPPAAAPVCPATPASARSFPTSSGAGSAPESLPPRPRTPRATAADGVPEEGIYTAKELAVALGMNKRTLLRRLENTPAVVRMVDGNLANAWPLAALPAEWQAKLAELCERGGYRSVHHLVTKPGEQWEPPLTLGECAPAAVGKATKLRTALAGALARRNDTTNGELLALGLADYQKSFGHVVTPQHWWGLLHRTMQRAGAREDFRALELYLDERPARKPEAQPAPTVEPDAARLHRLTVAASHCANPTALTDAERRSLWEAACATLAAELELGEPPHKARRLVLDYLWQRARGLAHSEAALRVAFVRKFNRWRDAGFQPVALADKRAEANRKRTLPVSQEDLDTLIGHTVFVCDGRVSQGVRECLQQRLVSEELQGRILHNPASKSYVPNKLRELVKHEVKMLRDVHHGPVKTRDNGAHLDRCWDSVAALDWFCADDCTLPVYFYVPDPKARSGFALMRGQFLLMIDTRSTAILGFALMPSRNYNAATIRSLVTRTADNYGLPRKGFYFERGIWKDAKILTGDKGRTEVEWADAEQGLREFGLRFIHAIRARSKPVERVLGALQNYMEGEPGYCGRDERRDGFESFARLKREIESGKVSPEGRLYSKDAWVARLGELCDRYNAEPQQGKHTGGLSPSAALEKFQRAGDPTVRFDARCRYLLAHHKKPVKIGEKGITLPTGTYLNTRTGELRGQMVLAWYDPESPEIITVTDMERRNPFCVERQQSVPAFDAPEEQIDQEMGRIEAHMGYATTRYRILKPKFDLPFRSNVVSPGVERLGTHIAEQTRAIATERREAVAVHRRVRSQAEKLGIPAPSAANPHAEEGLRLMGGVTAADINTDDPLP